ncbi:MAG: hypothetical protein JXB32_18665, partial [Deltaproteobacteria bacterium]|nr:hypothetical protein [Deltaproteobacteria bacterium]
MSSQDADTMDGVVDRICVDTQPSADSMALRVGDAGDWLAEVAWSDADVSGPRELHEARGRRRWCFFGLGTSTTDAGGVPFELRVTDRESGASEVVAGRTRCQETPSRNVGLDGRGGGLAIDLEGRPRAVTATRRGLRYHSWYGSGWREEWIDCLDGVSDASRGCPARPDWSHDYALEAGLALDFLDRPVVCFVRGERAAEPEPIFGDPHRYAQPAVPLPDARGTAFLAWRTNRGWRFAMLGEAGRAGMWGCSISSLQLGPGREEFVVAWEEEVAGPDGTPVLWPHVRRLIGPEETDGDFRLGQLAVVPTIWSEPVTCDGDATCGTNACEWVPPFGPGRCLVAEPRPTDDSEHPFHSHFVSVAAVLGYPARVNEIYVAFDIAAQRPYLAVLESPDCPCVAADSVCCATASSASVVGLGPTYMADPPGSGLADPQHWGLRPHLAIQPSWNAGLEQAAISFSARRAETFRGGPASGGSATEGWTPALLRLDELTPDVSRVPGWHLFLHEDAIAAHLGRSRAFDPTKRLPQAGLPTWVGFARGGDLRFAFATESAAIPADPANLIAAAPLRAVYAGRELVDPADPLATWTSYALVEGVTVSHLGLAAALSGADRLRLLFHNTLSPIAFGSPRPQGGDPVDWDLAMLGSVSFFEEESGQQLGSGLWGSPNYPCVDPPCRTSEPVPPSVPPVVAECKSSGLFEATGDAVVTDEEIALTPSLAPTLRRLAETSDSSAAAVVPLLMGDPAFDPDETACGGSAGNGLLQDLEALMGDDARKLLCDSITEERLARRSLTGLGNILRHASAVALKFQDGGALPGSFLAGGGALRPRVGLSASEVAREVPPKTSLPRWFLSGITVAPNSSVQASDQKYVCVNDDDTRRTDNLRILAAPQGPRTTYAA